MNGDGLPDIVGFGGSNGLGVSVTLNTGTAFAAAPGGGLVGQYTPASGWTDNNTYPRLLVDVNGDGLPDIVGFDCCGVLVALNTGTGFTAPSHWLSGQYGTGQGWSDDNTYPRFVVDVNGDGLPDIVGLRCRWCLRLTEHRHGLRYPDLLAR
jgi:hypothetical protein